MRILVVGLIAGIVLAPLAAFAEESAANESRPPAQPVSTAPSPDLVVCHYYYSHGTVVGHQDCHPLRYWAWRRHELQENIREFQLRSLGEKS
ncbi:MAG TPA: hypothetical protein VHY79_13510 [Rhizomicrobium sp.]|jgi:hypothetical protein|nr:hypothetical protein [Rhizomicrobium sp.]